HLNNIQYKFADLLKFQMTTLNYLPFPKQNFIVFPTMLEVRGLKRQSQLSPGENSSRFSPFEDPTNIQGIRDYTLQDHFRSINWKASLKAQTLQVNTYEQVADHTYHFVINVEHSEASGRISIHPKMENFFS